jgi:DeoR family suf operon transcriptional repressor
MQHVPASFGALGGFRGLRADLLVALKKAARPVTAKELAEQFAVTPNALRRHLDALEADELVRHAREVRGVGAPVHAYALTEAGHALFPQHYAPVLAAVLEAVRDVGGPEAVRAVLRRQWRGLVEGARPRLAELPLEERVQLVAELRSSQGYMAEARPAGPGRATIREHHCALRDVAERFPELCAAEQELMEELLGVPVERTGHILGGCGACEYTVYEGPPERDATAAAGRAALPTFTAAAVPSAPPDGPALEPAASYEPLVGPAQGPAPSHRSAAGPTACACGRHAAPTVPAE